MNQQPGPEPALQDSQRVVPLNAAILGSRGVELAVDARILDFGCGSGRHTYEYLDAGFLQTYGFDIDDYLDLRSDADRGRFRFLEKPDEFRLPFPDDHFDFVTSTSVFEHVTNLDESLSEIARVLKPDGVTLHLFPSRWRPIEPHMFVPFSGVIQSSTWFTLWASLGIRNGYQQGLSAGETAARNLEYCATGINYPPFATIDRAWRSAFGQVEYVEREFITASKHFSTVSRLADRALRWLPPLLHLYRAAHFRVVLARRPREARLIT